MTTEASDWQRVSPLFTIHHLLGFLRELANTNPGALAGMAAGGYAFVSRAPVLAGMAAVLLALLGIGLLIAAWMRFRYRVQADAIQLQQGVFTRQRLTLQFERIQNIRIERPPYLRIFGLARLSIESAGSVSQEVHLPGIPEAMAENLRDQALAAGQFQEPSEQGDAEAEAETARTPHYTTLLTRRPRDIIIYGISSPIILWGAVVISSILGVVTQRFEPEDNGNGEEQLQALIPDAMAVAWVVVPFLALVLILLVVMSIIMALVRYHGYRLEHDEDRYRLHSGLLTRREQMVRHHKIQHLHLAQNMVARFFRRRHLNCYQIGSMGADLPDGSGNSLVAPALTMAEQHAMVSRLCPGLDLNNLVFTPVSPRYMIPKGLFWFSIWLGLLMVAVAGALPILPILILAPVLAALIRKNWRRQGWAMEGDYLVLRGGLFGCHYTLFSGFRGQKLRLYQSPLQRRVGLGNLVIRLSSGGFIIPYIPYEQGQQLLDRLVHDMEHSKAPWL